MIEVKSKIVKGDLPKTKPISKLLKGILIVALLLFSMDFGLVKCKSLSKKITIKITVLAVAILLVFGIGFFIMSFYVYLSMGNIVWYSRYVIQVHSYVIILLLTPEKFTFLSFISNLHSIDAKIGVNSNSHRLDVKILLYWVITATYKWLLSVIYCTGFDSCLKPIWMQIIYFIPYSSLDIPLVFLFFIFYAARCRLVALRKYVESGVCHPKCFYYLYKSLIDSMELVKKGFDPIFCVTLFVDIPCIMVLIYQIIKEITVGSMSNNILGYSTEIAILLSSFFVIFAPAVAAGSLCNEVDKIRICYYNMLLEDNDLQKELDIQKLINYIEARPFKFNVLSVVAMDATLPMIVLNLCVTYIIVVLQLTHLF